MPVAWEPGDGASQIWIVQSWPAVSTSVRSGENVIARTLLSCAAIVSRTSPAAMSDKRNVPTSLPATTRQLSGVKAKSE
jgi:hypothetical protein